MGNAVWLTLALPQWYFGAVVAPFSTDPLTMLPTIGALALMIAAAICVLRRRREVLWFLVPLAGSHLFVAIAGLMRGRVGGDLLNPILLLFLVVELAICGVLIWRLRRARIEAALLSVFAMTYALEAAFIGAMAFPDVWI